MSRPFSYNDENFTVIGNLLFCHIRVTKALSKLDNIIEIPPDIYKRMFNKSNYLMCLMMKDDLSVNKMISVCVTKEHDEKYYIYVREGLNLDDVGKCLIGYYILKDI